MISLKERNIRAQQKRRKESERHRNQTKQKFTKNKKEKEKKNKKEKEKKEEKEKEKKKEKENTNSMKFNSLHYDIINKIVEFMGINDSKNLVLCSKYFSKLVNDHLFMKQIFIKQKGREHYEIQIDRMIKKLNNIHPKSEDELSRKEKKMVHINITNKTKDIPYDIFWINDKSFYPNKMNNKPFLPKFSISWKTYPCNRWFCIPTKDWFMNNNYSNIGYGFIVSISDLRKGEKSIKTIIKQPNYNKLDPIKGTTKKHNNYKSLIKTQKVKKHASTRTPYCLTPGGYFNTVKYW